MPVIHCITNYVTANDVANMVLAAGASPIMADGGMEVEDIAEISHGLVLNLGTLKENAIGSMLAAGRRAAALGHPVVLDPVGAGASPFRKETALRIIREVPCAVIRGNASEIRALAEETVFSRGVDADGREALAVGNGKATAAMAKRLSGQTGAVVVMTGATDMVADRERVCLVENGHPMMGRITGAGCMMDGVLAAVLSAGAADWGADAGSSAGFGVAGNPPDRFWQAVYGVAVVGICGELAAGKTLQAGGGTGSFRMYFIDAMSGLGDDTVRARMRLDFEGGMAGDGV